MAELLTIDVDTVGDTVTVRTAGEIDLSTVDQFRGRLHEIVAARPVRIVVDLAGVTFMSVGALDPIEEAAHALRTDAGGELILGERSRAVERLLIHVPIDPIVQAASTRP